MGGQHVLYSVCEADDSASSWWQGGGQRMADQFCLSPQEAKARVRDIIERTHLLIKSARLRPDHGQEIYIPVSELEMDAAALQFLLDEHRRKQKAP